MKTLIIATFLIFGFSAIASDSRGKIVVVDTGINKDQVSQEYMCKDGALFTIGTTPYASENVGFLHMNHGPNVVWIIGSRIDTKKYCIVSIKAFGKSSKLLTEGLDPYFNALDLINGMANVKAVNLSLSSSSDKAGKFPYLMKEHAKITNLVLKDVHVVVAAGNSRQRYYDNNCGTFPACLKTYFITIGRNNFTVVESFGSYSNIYTHFKTAKEKGDNVGEPPMTGTSQSAASYTGKEYSK